MSAGLSFRYMPRAVVRMQNSSGAERVAGDLCVLNSTAAGDSVTTTTTVGDNRLLSGGGFMALETIANTAYGRFLRLGFTSVLKVNGTTDIAIGDRLTSFSTAGIAQKAAVGDPYFAVALEAYATNDSLGVIDAILLQPGAEDPSAGAGTAYANGVTTRAGNAASGTQTIAHGLSAAPDVVGIIGRKVMTGEQMISDGVYNGTTTSCAWLSSLEVATGTSSTNIIEIRESGTLTQVATIAIDATNITLTWTRTGATDANTIQILWYAQT